jgi:hypothetical protein
MGARFCVRCGKPIAVGANVCGACGTPVGQASPATTGGGAPGASQGTHACPNCRATMRWVGHYSLRATGHHGAAAGAPVDLSQSPESLLPFSLYYCQSCGKFDFYYPGT